jgi:hypothetical protein
MREIILGGLLLPLQIYFQPTTFADRVAALAPDLEPDYNLWQARHKLRDSAFCRGLGKLLLQSIVALLWVPMLVNLGLLLGLSVDWSDLVSGVAIGVISGMIIGVTNDLPGGVALSVIGSLVGGVTGGLVSGVVGGVTSSIVIAVAGGMAVGVAINVAIGLTSGTTGETARKLTLGVVGGIVVGLALSVAGGIVVGVVGGVVGGMVCILIVTHALFLPFQVLLSFTSWIIIRNSPTFGPRLWRISPVRWDEIIFLALPGLTELLVSLNRTIPTLGRAAIAKVAAHRFQHRAAQQALVRLAQEDALLVNSLPGLAAFRNGLDWLSEESSLPQAQKSTLMQMRNISQEVASALESDSAMNRVRRLTEAQRILEALRLQPRMFGAALSRWAGLIEAGLEEARQLQREQEPIPQVYIKDGRPIRPTGHADTAIPFKGRAALFRQLETALGGAENERTTLVLYGQRRTGKTSALMQLPRRLGSQIVPAFIDLQSEKLGSAKDVVGVLGGLTDEIGEEVRRHRRLQLPQIDRAALANDPYPAFGRWLDQVERVLGEQTLLLCLDEFEALEDAIGDGRLDTRILSTIRNIVQHRRRIAVLLSGSHQVDELPPHWASALITTTTLKISFLDEPDARALIERPVADFPAIYTPDAVDRILQVTHCQPYLVQLLCALLVERMNTARRMPPASFVAVDDVQATIPLVLERGGNYFIDLWRSQTGSSLARRVLEELAHAPDLQLRRAAVRQIERDESAVREAINILLRREMIERIDDGYRMTVPLVAEYVRRETLV